MIKNLGADAVYNALTERLPNGTSVAQTGLDVVVANVANFEQDIELIFTSVLTPAANTSGEKCKYYQ